MGRWPRHTPSVSHKQLASWDALVLRGQISFFCSSSLSIYKPPISQALCFGPQGCCRTKMLEVKNMKYVFRARTPQNIKQAMLCFSQKSGTTFAFHFHFHKRHDPIYPSPFSPSRSTFPASLWTSLLLKPVPLDGTRKTANFPREIFQQYEQMLQMLQIAYLQKYI